MLDLNQRPKDYESSALTTELTARCVLRSAIVRKTVGLDRSLFSSTACLNRIKDCSLFHQLFSKKLLSFLSGTDDAVYAEALASIWRMRSRVTSNCLPTLQAYDRWSFRYRNAYATLWLRGVSESTIFDDVLHTGVQCFRRVIALPSSIKSLKCESSSSPIGVPWKSVLWRFSIFRIFALAFPFFGQLGCVWFHASFLQNWREIRFIC